MASEGFKHDQGKIKAGVLADFRLALMEVAKVGTFGAKKYKRNSWRRVENGKQRYYDALWRHLLAENEKDHESGLDHLAHLAWNILAVLELKMKKPQSKGPTLSPAGNQVQYSMPSQEDISKRRIEDDAQYADEHRGATSVKSSRTLRT